jgi:limonene-1,2-epoxide hydrolase
MAKQSKIEKFGCGDIVNKGIKAGKSVRQITQDCSDFAKEGISHTAVAKYIKDREDKEQMLKKEVIAMHKTRVLKAVNQEIDIIQTNLDATKRMIERFEMIDDMPKTFKYYMDSMYEIIEKNCRNQFY